MDVTKAVNEFLAKEIRNTQGIGPDTQLIASGLLDSIAKMKLISYLEKNFNIVVEAEDVESGQLETIRTIENFVHSRQKTAA